MAVYESGNMNRMRMEAVRRSQEMHRHSQHPAEIKTDEEKNENVEVKRKEPPSLLGKLFPEGKPDSDFLLTAVLIYLLYKEKADIKLILALAYILL